MTNKEHIEKYNELEKKGVFDQHINPIDWNNCYPVTKDFPYIKKKASDRFSDYLKNTFIINPFSWYQNKFVMKTKVFGRENLKGINSAVLTCNHVFIFDALAIKKAVNHKIKFPAAEFNNRKGFLGDMMRAGGMLPLSGNQGVMTEFNNAIEHYLLNDNYILFYPEQAMWHMYDKPRPFKEGAFYYAVKYDVPVVPLFITFRNSGKFDNEKLEIKYLDLHIMPPIYKQENLSRAKNVKYMMNKNYEMCKEKYEAEYGKALEFNISEK